MSQPDLTEQQLKYFRDDLLGLRRDLDLLENLPAIDSAIELEHIQNAIDLVTHKVNFAKLSKLPPGSATKLPRSTTPPLRPPLIITRDDLGNYSISFLLKGKRYDLSKRIITNDEGAIKVRKIALTNRGDKLEVWAELTVDVTGDVRLQQKIMQEIRIQKMLAKEFPDKFAHLVFGGMHSKIYREGTPPQPVRKTKMVILSPFRKNLYDLMLTPWKPDWVQGMKHEEILTEKVDIVLQFLDAIACIHAKNIEHKDLKFENILIDTSSNNRIKLEITDFGAVKKFGAPDLVENITDLAPWHIQSYYADQSVTKIEQDLKKNAIAGSKPNSTPEEIYAAHTAIKVLSSIAWMALKQHAIANNNGIIPSTPLVKISGKHDVWCAGIMMHDIIYGHAKPEQMWLNIQQDPCLKEIFKVNPNDIPEIATVKENFKQTHAYQLYDQVKPLHIREPQTRVAMSSSSASTSIGSTGSRASSVPNSIDWLNDPLQAIDSFVSAAKKANSDTDTHMQSLEIMLQQLEGTLIPNIEEVQKLLPATFEGTAGKQSDELLENNLDFIVSEICANLLERKFWKKDFDSFGSILIELLDKMKNEYDPIKRNISDQAWMDYAKARLYINIAATIVIKMYQEFDKNPNKIDFSIDIAEREKEIRKLQKVIKSENNPEHRYSRLYGI